MRILIACAACAATIAIAGCGGASDNEMLASFREHQVQSCISGIRSSPQASSLGLDGPRLCACAIDRYMAGKSAADLRDSDPHDPALRDATRQCQLEQMSEAAGAPPANEAGNAPGTGN